MADPTHDDRAGDAVRGKVTGRVIRVSNVYESSYAFRFRCAWDEDEWGQSDLFRPNQPELARDG